MINTVRYWRGSRARDEIYRGLISIQPHAWLVYKNPGRQPPSIEYNSRFHQKYLDIFPQIL